MYIKRNDVQKILDVMDEFPDARSYKLEENNSSGIGNILTLEMDMEIKGRTALVKIEISGVENW
jgi:hypothetical protein